MDRISAEHRDLSNCHALGLSKSGSLCLIVGGNQIGLVNLDQPDKLVSKEARTNSKHDVGEIQFSLGRETLCAIASGNKIDLIDFNEGGGMHTLSTLKHGNKVTDISWHEQTTHLLATASFDSFVYIWDTRQACRKRPAIELLNMGWTNRACWERISGKHLATAHEGVIKIWDIAYPKVPKTYLNAHPKKIFTLDFSPIKENQLASSSADNTIKIWSCDTVDDDNDTRLKKPINIFHANVNPVWKLKFTPFGEGLVTLDTSHTSNNLMLWSASPKRSNKGPVHKFYNHADAVQEFAWRNDDQASGRKDFELVTWGKDSMLTLWKIGGQLKGMCGGFEDEEVVDRQSVTAQSHTNEAQDFDNAASNVLTGSQPNDNSTAVVVNAAASVMEVNNDNLPEAGIESSTSIGGGASSASGPSTVLISRPSVTTVLKKELSSVEYGRLIFIQKIDLKNRIFQFQTETLNHLVYLEVRFPDTYPNEPPEFELLHRTTLSQKRGFAIIKRLRNVALGYTNRSIPMPCLEPCLKMFQQEMEAITNEEKNEQMIKKPRFYRDSNVPFPRISGARFCGKGQLVTFNWMMESSDKHLPRGARKTPRALSALSGNAAASGASRPAISSNSTSLSSLLENAITESSSWSSSSNSLQKASSKTSLLSSPGGAVGRRTPASVRHKMVRLSSVPAGQLLTNSSRSRSTLSESESADVTTMPGVRKILSKVTKPVVTIYDSTKALFFDRNLAEQYKIHGRTLEDTCRHNASVAYDAGYPDLGKLWLLASKFELVQHSNDKKILCDHFKRVKKIQECQLKYSEQLLCSCVKPPNHEETWQAHRTSLDPLIFNLENAGLPWALHPMGQQMLHQFLEEHSKVMDFQTVAVLSSIFTQSIPDLHPASSPKGKQLENSTKKKKSTMIRVVKPASHPHENVDEIGEASEAISASFQPESFLGLLGGSNGGGTGSKIKRNRSNSDISPSIDEFASLLSQYWYRKDQDQLQHEGLKSSSSDQVPDHQSRGGAEDLIDDHVVYDISTKDEDKIGVNSEIRSVLYLKKNADTIEYLTGFKQLYSDMLLRYGLCLKSAEILKTIATDDFIARDIDNCDDDRKLSLIFPYAKTCLKCRTKFSGTKCLKCDQSTDSCIICGLRIRGLSAYCMNCGHGGHYRCIKSYFQQGMTICAASGCGCNCYST